MGATHCLTDEAFVGSLPGTRERRSHMLCHLLVVSSIAMRLFSWQCHLQPPAYWLTKLVIAALEAALETKGSEFVNKLETSINIIPIN